MSKEETPVTITIDRDENTIILNESCNLLSFIDTVTELLTPEALASYKLYSPMKDLQSLVDMDAIIENLEESVDDSNNKWVSDSTRTVIN
jgi:hypothetical protein